MPLREASSSGRDGNPDALALGGGAGKLVSITNHQLASIAPDLGAGQVGGSGGDHSEVLAVALTPAHHQSLVVPVASDEDAGVLFRHAVPA